MGRVGRWITRNVTRLKEKLSFSHDDPDETRERLASNMEMESELWEKTATKSASGHEKRRAISMRNTRREQAQELRSKEEILIDGIFATESEHRRGRR